MLRPRVIATESFSYALEYLKVTLEQIIPPNKEQANTMINSKISTLRTVLGELSTILLTESAQKMVDLERMHSFFSNIKWHEPYYEIKDYLTKLSPLITESYGTLKSSSRG